jgi:DNA invertase Pin-like site-specific DNA recombinase
MIVGYARFSTDGQSLEAQGAALKAAGADLVYAEKQSGIKAAALRVACAGWRLGTCCW